ncbi:unnamed protein product [Somion occarium]|uniref:Transmembrane protein n=1 Tax=Somion occarium TaxID=3059160 RepID=A0ABP1DDY2_9APHY
MVDWNSAGAQSVTNFMYSQMLVFMTGLYAREYMLTLWFEWYLISQRIVFKWTYIPYLAGRYLILFVLCGLVAINRITHPFNCQVLQPLFITGGLVAGACATANLMIRTAMMWKHRRWLVASLIALSLGQVAFSLYAGTSVVNSHYDLNLRTCNLDYESHSVFAAVIYDLLILTLTWIHVSKGSRSSLWSTLRRQGLWYFLLTFMVNMPAMIFVWLNLNDAMNAMFYPPATTISVTISCRMVTSLIESNMSESMSKDDGAARTTSSHWKSSNSGTTVTTQNFTTNIGFPSEIYNSRTTTHPEQSGLPATQGVPSITA